MKFTSKSIRSAIFLHINLTTRITTMCDEALPRSRAAKVRGASLPPEYYLVQLVRHVENPHNSWSSDTIAHKWNGVRCANFTSENVVEIYWSGFQLRGVLQWEFLPRTLRTLILWTNEFSGSVEWQHLPRNLEVLRLSENLFTGPIELHHFPQTLKFVSLSKNNFTGNIDFTFMPPGMLQFYVTQNFNLGGTVRPCYLPISYSVTPRNWDWSDTQIITLG